MVEIYGIKNCGSVKKAINFFKENNISYALNDFKIKSVGCDKIEKWLESVDMKTLFNARSTTYKKYALKSLNLDDDAKKEWLYKENLLIKRPVIEFEGKLIVGFNEDNFNGVFL